MAKTGNQRYAYAKPDPFVTPAIELRQAAGDLGSVGGFGGGAGVLPVEVYQHDQLMYSGPIIENIMFHISLEHEFRGLGRVTWKAYKTGPNDFDTFIAKGSRNQASPFAGANNLSRYPVKFFPLYVRDIQLKIEELVEAEKYPDSLESLMARIFLNNTTHTGPTTWTGENRLPNQITVPVSEENYDQNVHTENILPMQNIQTDWAFRYDSNHVLGVVPRMGVDFRGQAYVNRGKLAVTTSDSPDKSNFQGNNKLQWPRSVIGQRRTEEDVRIVDGFLEDKEGSSVDGIDSIHIPGIPSDQIDSGRSKQFRQVADEDAVLPGAVGRPDLQSGYSWFAHHPHVLQQLRYQPPHVETWDNKTEVRDYVENVFSNNTPDLPWYFSQPVEKVHDSDWGGWLIQGYGGLQGPGMLLRAYADGQYDNITTNCPFSVFFPPASSNCTCGAQNTAYGIWAAAGTGFLWNNLFVTNNNTNSGSQKQFGPKTKLILDASFSLTAGNGSKGGTGWFLGIRTNRISSVNLQPFVPIMGQTFGNTDFGNIFTNQMEVNLMQAMKFHYPWYEIGGVDQILAIGIFVRSETGEERVVLAQDGPGGSFIPPTNLGCAMGEAVATCRKLYLFEPAWEGPGDPRTPPAMDNGSIKGPPSYNLPISNG